MAQFSGCHPGSIPWKLGSCGQQELHSWVLPDGSHLLPSAAAADGSAWDSQWLPSSPAPPKLPGSLRKGLRHRSGALTSVANAQRISVFMLCLWACVQARACVHRFDEMIANREFLTG